MNNEILFKPNGLILATADNTITSSEYKIYDTLLQRCQRTKDSHWRKAEISREEMKTFIKNTNSSTLEELKKVLDKFVNVKIKFKLGKKDVSATLIAEHIYDNETDIFTCSMSENVFIALMTYSEIGYSPIDLKLVRQAKGFYTQKIYGLLRMWSKQNEAIVKKYFVELIKDTCDIFEGTSYDRYNNFKSKVLIPAIKEINEKLNMKVEYKEIKVMRKVQEIEFTFTDYEPKKYDFNDDVTVIDVDATPVEDVALDQLQLLLRDSGIKIAINTINKLKEQYGDTQVDNAALILCNKHKVEKIKAPVKYLTGILENIKNKSISGTKVNTFVSGASEKNPYNMPADELELKLLGWDKE